MSGNARQPSAGREDWYCDRMQIELESLAHGDSGAVVDGDNESDIATL